MFVFILHLVDLLGGDRASCLVPSEIIEVMHSTGIDYNDCFVLPRLNFHSPPWALQISQRFLPSQHYWFYVLYIVSPDPTFTRYRDEQEVENSNRKLGEDAAASVGNGREGHNRSL